MKRLLILTSAIAGLALAQTPAPGTVVPITPAAGGFKATAGAVSCTVMGNVTAPATAAVIDCTVGPNKLPTAPIPLPAGSSYEFHYGWGFDPVTKTTGDSVTVILFADGAGKISWQAAATPKTGETASGSGSF